MFSFRLLFLLHDISHPRVALGSSPTLDTHRDDESPSPPMGEILFQLSAVNRRVDKGLTLRKWVW